MNEHDTSDAIRALAEGHRRLDQAKVPPAQYTVCDDSTCQSLIGHRIQSLAAERDKLKAQEQINNALMDEGATKILELQEEVRRLKEHVRDLNSDLESSTKECNDFHVDGRTL